MALNATYLSWSEDPIGFDANMSPNVYAHAQRVSPGVFVTNGNNGLAIVQTIASTLGAKVYTVEIDLTTLTTLP